MVQLASIADQFTAAGVQIWAVSPQSVAVNAAYKIRRSLPFTLLADPDQRVMSVWGIMNAPHAQRGPVPHPATYLIGGDGIVRWRHLGMTTRDRPAAGQLLAEALKVVK